MTIWASSIVWSSPFSLSIIALRKYTCRLFVQSNLRQRIQNNQQTVAFEKVIKKKKKTQLFLILTFFALCCLFVLSHCGLSSAIFQHVFREQLSLMTGCETRIKHTEFSALTGCGQIESLVISNPSSFPASNAISLKIIRFEFARSSLLGGRASINKLTLNEGAVFYNEANGVSNLSTIIASIYEYSENHPSNREVAIKRLQIIGWKCSTRLSPDDADLTDFNIPNIEIANLQGTSAEVGKQISEEISNQIREKLQSPGTMLRKSKNTLLSTVDNIGQGGKDLLADFIGALTGKASFSDDELHAPGDGPSDNDEE